MKIVFVARHDEDRLVGKTHRLDPVDDRPEGRVGAGDHRGVGRARLLAGEIPARAVVGRILEAPAVLGDRILRGLQRKMRHDRRVVEEER
ncbi:MAG: hypothetical protein RJA16_1678, partial [Planctomycetota bacterium]